MSEQFWQPTLEGPRCTLRPLRPEDFEALFAAASDPAVWEQHPVKDRYQREKFASFFDGAMKSKGALAIVHKASGRIIGSSRFVDYDELRETIEIGYTFLAKPYWGTGLNSEIKALMIAYAMPKVQRIFFFVGECNVRSQRALEKLGISRLESTREVTVDGRVSKSLIFAIDREQWSILSKEGAPLSLGRNDAQVPLSPRAALLGEVCAALTQLKADPVLLVAVDGVDGAGKTTFADELGSALLNRGCHVIRASVDGFHNPSAVRYRKGRDSPEGFFEDSYDYSKFVEFLIRPLSPGGDLMFKRAAFNHRTDSVVDCPSEQALPGSILLVDGIFLHRSELRLLWDFSIFLETKFEHSYARMSARDGCPPEPSNPKNRRYFEGQKIYLASCAPDIHASLVINNDDLDVPRIVKARATEQGNGKK